jgi:tetratricopeptide (TPR) repeat protein
MLTQKDTIVVADFSNTTGETIFDDTLKQALTADLAQSPFLNVLSDTKVADTLRLMGQTEGERINAGIARELCVRTASRAYLAGSIAKLGTHYALMLKAFDCQNTESLGAVEAEADGREQVLKTLGTAATKMRSRLGESRSSITKFDKPLEEVTTSSLDALKAFSEGDRIAAQKGNLESLPFLKRAVDLDPNFAIAYDGLGVLYSNLGQTTPSIESLKKAYELRHRTSQREQYNISADYYTSVTGELEKAIDQYRLWIHDYPRDADAYANLGSDCGLLGQYEEAAANHRQALTIDPDFGVTYFNLALMYVDLNRIDEARATIEELRKQSPNYFGLHLVVYDLAFLLKDEDGMQKELAWSSGKPELEAFMLAREAHTQTYYGHVSKGRAFLQRAIDVARNAEATDVVMFYQAKEALEQSELGNVSQAAKIATTFSKNDVRDDQVYAALALALSDEIVKAETVAAKLDKDFPLDTLVQKYWLPTIRAAIDIKRGNASAAFMHLQTASCCDMALLMHPIYIRGLAYLSAREGNEAAIEFQKIIDHPGIVGNDLIGLLARLNFARALTLKGDIAKARSAYQDFFAIWKDADPDIPILKEAKAEYAKLQTKT